MTDFNNDDRYRPQYGQKATPDNPGVKDGEDYYPRPDAQPYSTPSTGSAPYSPYGSDAMKMGQRPVTDSIPGMSDANNNHLYNPHTGYPGGPAHPQPPMSSAQIEHVLPKVKGPIILFITGLVLMLIVGPILFFAVGAGALFNVIDMNSQQIVIGQSISQGESFAIDKSGTYYLAVVPGEDWQCQATDSSGQKLDIVEDADASQPGFNEDNAWMGSVFLPSGDYAVTCESSTLGQPNYMNIIPEAELIHLGLRVLVGILGGLFVGFVGLCLTIAGAIWWGVRGRKRKEMRQQLLGYA